MSDHARLALAPWIAVALLLLLWELGCPIFPDEEFLLPTPSAAVGALVQYAEAIWHKASFTVRGTLLGFALAVLFGLLSGVATGASRLAYTSLYPISIGFNSIPRVAIVPILVIWFGIGAVPPRCSPPS
jgi:NitT/TauT family transport system permease protein